MKKILITGGTGFVGTYLTALVREREPQAEIIVTAGHKPEASESAKVVVADLTDEKSLTALIAETRPDEIYHLASLSNVAQGLSEPAVVLRNNVDLTLNLLEAIRTKAPQTRLLLVSSGDVYDTSDPAPIDEHRLLRPLNPYAVSKATQDLMGQAYARSYGLQIVIVRPFNHIGPGQRLGFVVPDFASKIVAAENGGSREIVVGNLSGERDFTDVRDMVEAYWLLMNRGQVGEIYNAGSGVGVKIEVILNKLVSQASVPVTIKVDQSKYRPIDAPRITVDATKLRALGWQPRWPLDQTLTEILAFWRQKAQKGNSDP